MDQTDATGLAGNAADRACRLQCLDVVLGRPDPTEAECLGDFRLGWRHAIGFDAGGDHRKDGLLGVGQIHG